MTSNYHGPMECGCILVKRGHQLSVSQNPAYKRAKCFNIPSLFLKRILGRPGSIPGEGVWGHRGTSFSSQSTQSSFGVKVQEIPLQNLVRRQLGHMPQVKHLVKTTRSHDSSGSHYGRTTRIGHSPQGSIPHICLRQH